MLHGHGDDAYQHGDAVRLNFSSNVRPGGAPAALCAHLAGQLARIGTYPEVAAETLTARLAARLGVGPEHLIVTNGAVAGIHLIAQMWAGVRSRVVTPTFSEYEDAARLHRHVLDFAPWATALQPLPADCELLWVCNPNNPTGAVLAREPLLAWIDAHPGTVFVVDLAYADFCATAPLTAQDATSRANLILVHSLTKNYGLPGLRLGYLVTTPGLRQRLANGLVPWAVNCLALAAGNYCLDHSEALTLPLDAMLADAESLGRALANIPGVTVHPSTTTFLLFELPPAVGSAAALKIWLIREHGMLVRDAGNFRGLGPQAVRVATQGQAADAQLVAAVRQRVAKGVVS
jgi:threonine-phosphate decarboxylase